MSTECQVADAAECAANVIPKSPEIVVPPPLEPVQAPLEICQQAAEATPTELMLIALLSFAVTYAIVRAFRG